MRTYISDSLISEALIFLQVMENNKCFSTVQIESMKTYYGINKVAALNLAQQCKWVVMVNEATYEITSYGKELLREFNNLQIHKNLYRNILHNYITTCKPIWARKIPFGRNEAYRIMSDEEQVCFQKAGLMSNPVTRDEVDWWDSLAELERIEIEHQKDKLGREGEQLTFEYEKTRTRVNPIWESINSNLAGFDIMSQVSRADASPILIEVKSSNRKIQNASFFVTRNEWRFASAGYNINRYYFYLWILGNTPQLAIIPCSAIEKHIPKENGQGQWRETVIPFSAFQECFVVIDSEMEAT